MKRLLDALGYTVETDEGLLFVRPLDRMMAQEKQFLAMGVNNTCPRCKTNKHALMFGDPDNIHWCIVCNIHIELEEIEHEYLQEVTGFDVS